MENSEIVPSAPYLGTFCVHCDLEYDHAGECQWEDDPENDDDDRDRDHEPYEDSVWADSDALASIGWGTDEDYGFYGDDY